jgi:hypothetical protein
MTGLLKDTLTERAAAADEPPLDLDAIIDAGNTRIRRRRTTTVAAVVAASALVLAGGVVTAKNLADPAPAPANGVPTFKERRPTFATGGQIHFGADVIKVGPDRINSFIQTDAGFVFTTGDGTVYFTAGRGNLKIGSGNKRQELTADDDGTVVGWVDAGAPVRQFVLYDVATGEELARTPTGNTAGEPPNADREPRIIAIDNNQAYLAALDGLHRWDIAKSADTMLKAGLRPNALLDVANDRLAYLVDDPGGPTTGIAVAAELGSTKVVVDGETDGNLSPDGKHFFAESGNETYLYATDGSGEIKLNSAGHGLMFLSTRLDNDRFSTVGMKTMDDENKTPLDLMTCSVKTASCTVTVPRFAPYPTDQGRLIGWQLPIGKAFTN